MCIIGTRAIEGYKAAYVPGGNLERFSSLFDRRDRKGFREIRQLQMPNYSILIQE
jgi:hypothetical protein